MYGLKQSKSDIHVCRKVPRKVGILIRKHATQLTFTFSKSTIETLEKGAKYVQS